MIHKRYFNLFLFLIIVFYCSFVQFFSRLAEETVTLNTEDKQNSTALTINLQCPMPLESSIAGYKMF